MRVIIVALAFLLAVGYANSATIAVKRDKEELEKRAGLSLKRSAEDHDLLKRAAAMLKRASSMLKREEQEKRGMAALKRAGLSLKRAAFSVKRSDEEDFQGDAWYPYGFSPMEDKRAAYGLKRASYGLKRAAYGL